jgi:putative DNA primase/helicase
MTPINSDNIPIELKERKNWIIWKLEEKTDTIRGKKTPYQIKDPHKFASSTNPETWGYFAEAVAIAPMVNASGIGYVFTEDQGIIAGDADNHEKPGTPEYEKAEENIKFIVELLKGKTYLEYSHSGKGIHFLIKGPLPLFLLKGIEIYITGRYFAMTGNKIGDCTTINELQRYGQSMDKSQLGTT